VVVAKVRKDRVSLLLRHLIQWISDLMVVEAGQMNECAAERIHGLSPAVERVGQLHHLSIRNGLTGVAAKPTPASDRVLDQPVPILPIGLRKQKDHPNKRVEFLAENRRHLPRDRPYRSHSLRVLGRPNPYLTAECLDVVHVL
jgi:hypothetical protein